MKTIQLDGINPWPLVPFWIPFLQKLFVEREEAQIGRTSICIGRVCVCADRWKKQQDQWLSLFWNILFIWHIYLSEVYIKVHYLITEQVADMFGGGQKKYAMQIKQNNPLDSYFSTFVPNFNVVYQVWKCWPKYLIDPHFQVSNTPWNSDLWSLYNCESKMKNCFGKSLSNVTLLILIYYKWGIYFWGEEKLPWEVSASKIQNKQCTLFSGNYQFKYV